MSVLTVGDFAFEIDDLPSSVSLGGDAMMNVIQYPGGHKEVQWFGVQDRNPAWTGVLNYSNAIQKAQQLDKMYRSGDVYPIQVSKLMTRYGIVKKFEWDYQSDISIPYSIELELSPKTSILAPTTSATTTSSSTPASSGTSSPASDNPAPQKTYVVVDGDSLWSIAKQYYNDGSQWQKIATANNITNPDLIDVGQRLVIP